MIDQFFASAESFNKRYECSFGYAKLVHVEFLSGGCKVDVVLVPTKVNCVKSVAHGMIGHELGLLDTTIISVKVQQKKEFSLVLVVLGGDMAPVYGTVAMTTEFLNFLGAVAKPTT